MKLILLKSATLIAAALAIGAPAQAAEPLIDLYKTLHANPELSHMESETSKMLGAELETLGFDVTYEFGSTGTVAVFKNGDGPTVLIRADMDALPVTEATGASYASTKIMEDHNGNMQPVMHACGHDIHMTVFMGTARDLIARKAEWSGTLVMILQPAEELGQGARAMIGAGLFDKFPRPDYNLALHTNSAMPAGTVGYTPGYALANVDSVDITVRGIGGHGAYPNTTKDPIVLAAQLIQGFQTIVSREISPTQPAVVTVGSIHGGTKHNIIGDEVKMQLTLRSYSPEVRQQTLAAIRRMADGMGRAYGLPEDKLPIVIHQDEFTPAAFNNPALSERAANLIAGAIGEKNVIKVDPVMGGEDFGEFGQVEPKIPSFIYWLGAVAPADYAAAKASGATLPSLHSPTFLPDAAPTIDTGVKAMSASALGLFNGQG
ncbi:amidohydrolase [Robiginitomaculum antarcticum]|uniref:amidohydrolase n=1 Tax=Robiginitomaculum antarcticum TaxID=437507 RepID=UPI00035D893B|nr:amidohydrolase [Robiginitomaculum antarcticum]